MSLDGAFITSDDKEFFVIMFLITMTKHNYKESLPHISYRIQKTHILHITTQPVKTVL